MAAAIITAYTRKEISTVPGIEVVRVFVTTSGDWFMSKFGKVHAVFVHDETTTGGAKAVVGTGTSSSKITITATASDYVNLLIFGE